LVSWSSHQCERSSAQKLTGEYNILRSCAVLSSESAPVPFVTSLKSLPGGSPPPAGHSGFPFVRAKRMARGLTETPPGVSCAPQEAFPNEAQRNFRLRAARATARWLYRRRSRRPRPRPQRTISASFTNCVGGRPEKEADPMIARLPSTSLCRIGRDHEDP